MGIRRISRGRSGFGCDNCAACGARGDEIVTRFRLWGSVCYGALMCRIARAMVALVIVTVTVARAATPQRAPEETLREYLTALKEGKIETAYDRVSKAMRHGKSREDWAKEQREFGSLADVKIFGFDVGASKIEGEKAFVPNVLKSQDKLINQMGLTEYELYTLIVEDGEWKVDQQILVEPQDMGKWFPKVGKPAPPAPSKTP